MASFWDVLLFVVFFPLLVAVAAASIPLTVFCGIPLAILYSAVAS